MSTVRLPARDPDDNRSYPTSDGRPMAETDWHRILMTTLIQTLGTFFAASPSVYVSGNLLIFYERGNRRRHISPDVFAVRGVGNHRRLNYLTWVERKGPDFVIELTSSSTRHEDVRRKYELYRDVLRVKEYFLFDPFEDWLDPPMQGHRLRAGVYHPIRPVRGRLPSRTIGLHLERDGSNLRFYDPNRRVRVPTPEETLAATETARDEAEMARSAAEMARSAAETARSAAETARAQAEQEIERLRRENEELRRRLSGDAGPGRSV